jgi:hypothetical protein
MRWPFRRRTVTDHGQPEKAPPASAGSVPGPTGRDWEALPALRSATAVTPPLTAEAGSFVARLPTRRSLVGHPVLRGQSGDAPRGLVHGAAATSAARPQVPIPEPDREVFGPQKAAQGEMLTTLPGPRKLRPGRGGLPERPMTEVAPDMVPATLVRRPADDMEEGAGLPTSTEGDGGEPGDPTPPVSVSNGPILALLPPATDPGDEVDEPAGAADPPARSRRANVGMSRRLGLGPAYHRPLPEAIRLEHADRASDQGRPASGSPSMAPVGDDDHEVRKDPQGKQGGRQEGREQGRQEGRQLDVLAPQAPAARHDANQQPPIASGTPAPGTEPVPDDVRTELRGAYGVDVETVHRGPGVSRESAQLGARAFARGGEAYIPREAGRLDTPEGKSIVAHELTHVSQQRRTAGLLPPEDTTAGRALEAEAQEAERFFRGDADATPPSSWAKGDEGVPGKPSVATDDAGHAGLGEARALMDKLVSDGVAVSDGQGGIVFTQAPPSGSSTGVQRQITAAPPANPSGWPPATTGHPGPFGDRAPGVGPVVDELGGDLLTSGAGLDVRLPADVVRARNDTERDLAVQLFREVKLQHRKTQVLAEHPESSLSDDEERALDQEVQEEVERRLLELETRVDTRLDATVGSGSAPEDAAAAPVLQPEDYRRVVRDVFGDLAGPLQPEATGDAGLGRRVIRQGGPSGGSGADEMARVGMAALAALSGDGTDRRPPGGTTWPDGQERRGVWPSQPGGGAGGATASSAFAVAHRDRAVHAASGSAADQMAGGALARASSRVAFVERAAGSAAAELAGAAREFAPASTASIGPAGVGQAATGPVTEGHASSGSAGVATIGPARAGQAAVGSTGHEQLDLDHLDLDELSARIYGRLRRRLRAELLIDRERAGLLTDFH